MSAMDEKVPPISWSLWRRIRFFGAAGVLCGGIVIALELLIADIPGERAFNRFTPGGAVSLWPTLRMIATFAIVCSLAIAVSLPLYRYRHGWAGIAIVVYLLFFGSAIASGGRFSFPGDAIGRLQLIVSIIALAFMTAICVHGGRSLALGQPENPSSELPLDV
jgi:hypothetical protein